MISLQFIIVFFISIFIVIVIFKFQFRQTSLYKINFWRNQLKLTLFLNIVGFGSVAVLFYSIYGYITDDRTYFYEAMNFNSSFFELQNGTEFMFYITKPIRKYLNLNIASMHCLFGTIGFLGCLNFLFIQVSRSNFRLKFFSKINSIKLFSIMCFPNLMLWGRIYGKDTLVLFLSSICAIATFNLISIRKFKFFNLLIYIISIILIFKIRSHIALSLVFSSLIVLYFYSLSRSKTNNPNSYILYHFLIPIILFISAVLITPLLLQKLVRSDKISVDNIQSTIIESTKMGAYGGSSTELSSDLKDDSKIIFKPSQIAINIFNLLFAPMPWQIRNILDIIAFGSNALLFYLIIKFRKMHFGDIFQKYLLVNILLLVLILSFMTGNVGLILRQKTIILPFLFLFLFYTTPEPILEKQK